MGVVLGAAALLLSAAPAASPLTTALKPWADSTSGIHTILIGDGSDTSAQDKALVASGEGPDFIWGGGLRLVKEKPEAVSTKYVAFTHDPTNNYNYTWCAALTPPHPTPPQTAGC